MEWKYYNNGVVVDGDIREDVSLSDIHPQDLFKKYKKALMIQYTSDMDYISEGGEWWHCIKDDPYCPENLKARRRYNITKARKNFLIKQIDPLNYVDDIYEISLDAFLGYSYKIEFSYQDAKRMCEALSGKENTIFLGAFLRESGELCGFSWLEVKGRCIYMVEQKVIREYERLLINAALCDATCLILNERISSGYYLYDGDRNVLHQTNFQDYLIKLFGFRRAYCKLHIIYRPIVKPIISILFVFRNLISLMANRTNCEFIKKVKAVLDMEEIARKTRELKA
jgi:hypothetical protein